jgi:hypothetical protein
MCNVHENAVYLISPKYPCVLYVSHKTPLLSVLTSLSLPHILLLQCYCLPSPLFSSLLEA